MKREEGQRFAADEILAKALAYRDLRLNEVILLPYLRKRGAWSLLLIK